MIEYITYPLIFLFLWITGFLWHELWHIIGTGRLDGSIYIHGLSMSASPANLLSGGLGSGLMFLLLSWLVYPYVLFTLVYMMWIVGITNIIYSVFEYRFLPYWGNDRRYKLGRYGIYVSVIVVMIILYWVVIE